MAFSIITAIHNGLAMNQFYWSALSQNTETPFELILVDNHSTDGSEHFFADLARESTPHQRVIYVRNEVNQSYPVSQIQGMEYASFDRLAFLNNDIWMPKGWEKPLLAMLEMDPRLVVCPSGQEAQPTQGASDYLKRRWKWASQASFAWKWLLRKTELERLEKAVEWMYGDLANFRSPTERTERDYFHGIKGDSVFFRRSLLEVVPRAWHERVEASDWHLYLQLAHLHETNPQVPLPRIATASYVHHFGRYSAHQGYELIPRREPPVSIDEFWGTATVRRLWWGHHLPR